MAHSTLALLGACCLAAALLGAHASAARTPAALQGAFEPAQSTAREEGGPWSCASYGTKAWVTAFDVQRTADGGLNATVTFSTGKLAAKLAIRCPATDYGTCHMQTCMLTAALCSWKPPGMDSWPPRRSSTCATFCPVRWSLMLSRH